VLLRLLDAFMTDERLMPCDPPELKPIEGESIRLEPIDPKLHAVDLERHLCGSSNEELWEHIPFGAPQNFEQLHTILSHTAKVLGWMSFAIRDQTLNEAVGTLSLMRLRPEHGSAEVGCVVYGKQLQKSRGGTEAIYLLAKLLFCDLNYRRFEWKCNVLNDASKAAAKRFGFQFEGIFRNDMIVSGRSRDTAWYSMTDTDWTSLHRSYETWLDGANFDNFGRQKAKLGVAAK